MLVKKIEKWYKELKFDKKYDEAFYDLVKRRAEYEVRLRVIESYKKYDHFWWMRAEPAWM